jgi:hypothetical protein
MEETLNNIPSVEEVTEIAEQNANLSPEDAAVRVWTEGYPVFVALTKGLSNKDARRLAVALMAYPLEDIDESFNGINAKNAFQLSKRLMDAKMIMRDFVMQEVIQEQIEELNKTKKEETENG